MNEELGCIEAMDELWREVIEASLFSVVCYIALDINAIVNRKTRVTRDFITTPGHYLPFAERHVQMRLRLGGPSISLETGLSTKKKARMMVTLAKKKTGEENTITV